MKMVKSLLLGTAAGFVAVAGAQAADMPTKARAAPVQFVRICTLYGDGFYYVPGTDTCLKLGGLVRVQTEWGAGGGGVPDGWAIGGQQTQAMYDRVRTSDTDFRVRGALSLDVRDQTAFGTLRSYFRIGIQQTTPADGTGGAVFWDRAFIQWAGFTIGKAQSFYDTVTYGGAFSYHNVRTVSDTGASGWNVWAYTAQFGNGFSATLSLEDPNRDHRVTDNTQVAFVSFPLAQVFDNGLHQQTGINGFRAPDYVGQVRWDQAWGYVAASVAAHHVNGAYFLTPNNVNNGHPFDTYGYAVSVGALFRITGGHTFGINGQWSKGAVGYGAATGNGFSMLNPGSSAAWGFTMDGIFSDQGTEIELTTAWNVIAFFEYRWNPQWKTAWFAGYVKFEYSDLAKFWINPIAVCGGQRATPFGGVTILPGNSCDPDWGFWQVGSRTQWNPHPNLDIGVEVLYTRVQTAYEGPAIVVPGLPQNPVNRFEDLDKWSAFMRWQRNFYP